MDVPADSLDIRLANVEGLTVAKGDIVSVELGYADGALSKVIEAPVDCIESAVTALRIRGLSAMTNLLALHVYQTYEEQTAGDIVTDLAGQAEITTGDIEDGIEFAAYVVDNSRNAYQHMRILAEKCGFDIYLDVDNKLVFKEFTKSSADHTFEYAKDIINLELSNQEQQYQQVEVWGESPVSSKGDETSHWLTKSREDFKGAAGSGSPLLLIHDASITTKDAAESFAGARLKSMERHQQTGELTVLGYPEVKLGDAIEIKGMPDSNTDGTFQVRRVSHLFNKTSGFITTIGWMSL
jgi:phage protein D